MKDAVYEVFRTDEKEVRRVFYKLENALVGEKRGAAICALISEIVLEAQNAPDELRRVIREVLDTSLSTETLETLRRATAC